MYSLKTKKKMAFKIVSFFLVVCKTFLKEGENIAHGNNENNSSGPPLFRLANTTTNCFWP